jgi:outer membrane protein assembly factor BamE (lipoprotein component of BamABCDE complex)
MEPSNNGRLPAWAALGLVVAMLVAACDPQRVEKLEEGVATEAQVRQQFGEPANIVLLPDGSRAFEYPRQPEGWTNYLITIGPDGKMSALRQLLNEDNFARLEPGLSGMQVRQMLGRPALQQHFDLKNEDVLSWRFKQHGQESKLFSATFVGGKLTAKAIADDPREAGR